MQHDYLLSKFVSRDETRPFLGCVFMDSKTKQAIATDGHRLFLSQSSYVKKLADKMLISEGNVRSHEKAAWLVHPDIKCDRFPTIQRIVEPAIKNNEKMLRFTVPMWLGDLKMKCHKVYIFVQDDGKLSLHDNDDVVFAINGILLAELACENITMFYNNDMRPILFFLNHDVMETTGHDHLGVIMPLKRDSL